MLIELDAGTCPVTYDYLDTEVEGYFAGVRAMREEESRELRWCRPSTFGGWLSALLSLECRE